jgi:hypothetical protein
VPTRASDESPPHEPSALVDVRSSSSGTLAKAALSTRPSADRDEATAGTNPRSRRRATPILLGLGAAFVLAAAAYVSTTRDTSVAGASARVETPSAGARSATASAATSTSAMAPQPSACSAPSLESAIVVASGSSGAKPKTDARPLAGSTARSQDASLRPTTERPLPATPPAEPDRLRPPPDSGY